MNEEKNKVITVFALLPFQKDLLNMIKMFLININPSFESRFSFLEKETLTKEDELEYLKILQEMTEEEALIIEKAPFFAILVHVMQKTIDLLLQKEPELYEKVNEYIEKETFIEEKQNLYEEIKTKEEDVLAKIREQINTLN